MHGTAKQKTKPQGDKTMDNNNDQTFSDGKVYEMRIGGFNGILKKGDKVTKVSRRQGGVYMLQSITDERVDYAVAEDFDEVKNEL